MTDWHSHGRRPAGNGSQLDNGHWLPHYLRVLEDNQVRRQQPAPEHVELAVEVFRMLADATRVQILWALLDGELPVNDLAAAVGKPPAGVSQHLAKLRLGRLVGTRRQGTQVFYRLENSHVRQLVEDGIYHADHAGQDIPEHHKSPPGVTAIPTRDQRTGERG